MQIKTLVLSAWLKGLLLLTLAASAQAATYYVAPSGSDGAAGTSWSTAKQTIQAAIDLTVSNDTVLVSNGVYSTGGRVVYGAMTNRIVITKAITVRSVNGPVVTVIKGGADPISTNGNKAIRCAYIGSDAIISGFTFTNGHTRAYLTGDIYKEQSGGGIYCVETGVETDVETDVETGSHLCF